MSAQVVTRIPAEHSMFPLPVCLSTPVDTSNRDVMLSVINSSITTKAISRWAALACSIALDAVKTVQFEENGRKEIDIKKYARVEKVNSSSQCFGDKLLPSMNHPTCGGNRFKSEQGIFIVRTMKRKSICCLENRSLKREVFLT